MTQVRRLVLAGVVVAAAEALLGVVALRTGVGGYLLACGAATLAVAVAAGRVLGPSGGDHRRSADGGEDGGGGHRPHGPGAGPSGDDGGEPAPPWWPEFEAAFREHARERAQSRAPV